MGYYLVIAAGIIGPFFMIKYRESLGDMLGEADWMRKVGGIHNFIVIIAILIFFWALADVTGTTSVLFGPLRSLSPAFQQQTPPSF